MSSRFDWLRQSRNGAELLATLRVLRDEPALMPVEAELGPPHSALNCPCRRCWRHPHAATKPGARYCSTCQSILDEAAKLVTLTPYAVIVWGFVTALPRSLRNGPGAPAPAPVSQTASPSGMAHAGAGVSASAEYATQALGVYVHDEHHFLVILYHRDLQPWLRELAIYHGGDLKGLLQIVPATGGKDMHMGELLCRIIHDEARFPKDRLRLRFFSAPHQVFDTRLYEKQGVLTFEVAEFLRMLDLGVVFRSILRPDEQKILHQLLTMDDNNESQFYWGRFLGLLRQEAKDMLNAWRIRQWSKPQINLLYELVEYVGFYQSR